MGGPTTTRYARSGELHIGYQVAGEGPVDLLELVAGAFISVDESADEPHFAAYEERLASFARVLRYDQRGTGLSDPLPAGVVPTIDQWVDDAVAVLDHAGSERAVVVGTMFGGSTALRLAARHPERVSALVLVHSRARYLWAEDFPIGVAPELVQPYLDAVIDTGGDLGGDGVDDVALFAPSLADRPGFRRWWARAGQRGASPAVARAIASMFFQLDLRPDLARITAPTLVLGREQGQPDPTGLQLHDHSRYLVDHIAGARFVGLPGPDMVPYGSDATLIADEIEEFVTGQRRARTVQRALTTVLFTDIVESTQRAAALGDQRWREVLDDHDRVVSRLLVRHGGRKVNPTGDGMLATFDGPAQAVRCALAIVAATPELGVEVRAGIHTGEVELRGEDIGGIAVHIGARVSALAGPGQVLVSRTVTDLVAGSGLRFEEHGTYELKGVPGSWTVFVARP